MLAVLTIGISAAAGYGVVTVVFSVTLEAPEPDASDPMFHVTVRVPLAVGPAAGRADEVEPSGSTSVMTALVTLTADSLA